MRRGAMETSTDDLSLDEVCRQLNHIDLEIEGIRAVLDALVAARQSLLAKWRDGGGIGQ
jgi:hypothetical protein